MHGLIDLAPPGIDELTAVIDVTDALLETGGTGRPDRDGYGAERPRAPAPRDARPCPGLGAGADGDLLKYQSVAGVGELGAALLKLSQGLGRLQDAAGGFTTDVVRRRQPAGGAAEGRDPAPDSAARGAGCSRPADSRQCRWPGDLHAMSDGLARGDRELKKIQSLSGGRRHARVPMAVAPSAMPPPHGPAALRRWQASWRAAREEGTGSWRGISSGGPLMRLAPRRISTASFTRQNGRPRPDAGRSSWGQPPDVHAAEIPVGDCRGRSARHVWDAGARVRRSATWTGSQTSPWRTRASVEHFSRRRRSTVLPMKLFTMFSTVDRAVEETSSRSREIGAVVKRIAGCEEWGVRMTRVRRRRRGLRAVGRARTPGRHSWPRRNRRATRNASVCKRRRDGRAVYDALAAIARDARAAATCRRRPPRRRCWTPLSWCRSGTGRGSRLPPGAWPPAAPPLAPS